MVDLLDLGFNIVIGMAALAAMIYVGWQVKRVIEKQIKEDKKDKGTKELEDDLDDFFGV